MKVFSRDFTFKEKILLLVLCLILLGLAYYQFVDQTVRGAIQQANSEREAMELELVTVQARLGQLDGMKTELEEISSRAHASIMGSYNNSKAEIKMLNDILEAADDYAISFNDLTRDGDQVRRNFTLQFTAANYDTMTKIISQLTQGKYRCLLGNVQCSSENGDIRVGQVSVSATATFYETMVGGTPDSLLPQEENTVEETTGE